MSQDPGEPLSASVRKRKSDGESFSDASNSYWPEGWSWARYSDHEVNFSTLSEEEEKDKMRNGLQEVLGDDGMRRMRLYLRQKMRDWEEKKLQEQGALPPNYKAPDFLMQWQKKHPIGPWGFVAFRTVLHGDEEKWTEFKRRVRLTLHVAFDYVVEQHEGHEFDEVAKARKTCELHWIEDKKLALMEEAEVIPHGDEEDEHGPDGTHDERNWYKSVFKVPVEIIPDNLWYLVDPHSFSLRASRGE